VTGWPVSGGELRRIGERINIFKRLFNQREGWRPRDDWLPSRLLTEALPSGVAAGVGLTAHELREMIRGYYDARDLDDEGFVTEATLRALDVLNAPLSGIEPCQATRHGAY
jgi:aldehyde:ferredoxin oxidoreductase